MRVATAASLGRKRPPAPDDLGENGVWVATAGLMCCGCHESAENGSQERERGALRRLSRIITQPSSTGTLGDTEL